SDFNFDFGFGKNPPPSASPPRPTTPGPADDPIADLIAAELDGDDAQDSGDALPEPPAREEKPVAPPRQVFGAMTASAGRPASAPAPLKPVSVAPRAPATDRFTVSPGAGLDMKPVPGQAVAPPSAPKVELTDESDP